MFVNPGYRSISQSTSATPIVVITSSKGSQSLKDLLPKYVEETPLSEDPSFRRVHTISKEARNRWKSVSVIVALTSLIAGSLIALSYYNYESPRRPHNMMKDEAPHQLSNGDVVYVRLSNGHYLRADQKEAILTSDFPWLQGSRFVVETDDEENWKLKVRQTGEYVVITSDTSQLALASEEDCDANGLKLFLLRSTSSVPPAAEKGSSHGSGSGGGVSSAPEPHEGRLYEVGNQQPYKMLLPYGVSEGDDSSVHVRIPGQHASLRVLYDTDGKNTDTDTGTDTGSNTDPATTTTSEHSVVFVQLTPKIRGVNIGSWFIPERWMNTAFYNGVDVYWSQLCGLVQTQGVENAEKRMAEHLLTWFTDDDFDFLHTQGINSIRLPVGYWNVIQDTSNLFVPQNPETSLHFIDWAFEKAAERGMSVLLDLHGAPGSQNGNDHSGCGYGSSHGEGWNTEENRALSLRAVEALAKRYASKPNLVGIELLNEPAKDLEENHHNDLKQYYADSYAIIRKYSATTLVVFNVLWSDHYDDWFDEFVEPDYYNILIDWHLYDWGEHFSWVKDTTTWLTKHSTNHPIVVGEWSAAMAQYTGSKTSSQDFLDAELSSFNQAWGWYYWNFKVMDDDFRIWSFESAVKDGYDFGLKKPLPRLIDPK